MKSRCTFSNVSRLLAPVLFAGLLVGCASSNKAEQPSNESSTTSDKSQAQQPPEEPSAESRSSREVSAPSEKAPESSDNPDSDGNAQISDQDLEEFVQVSRRMQRLQTEARRNIQNAESKTEAQEIKQKSRAKLQSIFDDSSLTKEKYRKIGMRLKSDKKLRKRLEKINRESRPSGVTPPK